MKEIYKTIGLFFQLFENELLFIYLKCILHILFVCFCRNIKQSEYS